MVESRDELLIEIAREVGLDRMGEDDDEEEEDANNGGDATPPPTAAPPPPAPLLLCLKRSTKRALWRRSRNKEFQSRNSARWRSQPHGMLH
jgi:hypothetical protein